MSAESALHPRVRHHLMMTKAGIESVADRMRARRGEPERPVQRGRGRRGRHAGPLGQRTIPAGSDDSGRLGVELGRMVAGEDLARHCWVTLWGIAASHQLLGLPPGKPSVLEARARREAVD